MVGKNSRDNYRDHVDKYFLYRLIPSYATIGIWAPILLLLCKMAQGFSVGGEYTGASIFVAEYSPDRKRGFMGSWLDFGPSPGL